MEKEQKVQTTKSIMMKLYRENYLNAYRVIVAGSRGFLDYDIMCRELDKLFFFKMFCQRRGSAVRTGHFKSSG